VSSVVTKAIAEIVPGADDSTSEHGTFEVILSAETTDRDGDTLKSAEWETPLPDHITFDMDHGMSVATTIGSGKPRIDDDGTLRVTGAYSSIPRGQEVRTLVNEGHIRTTSVAFLTKKDTKGVAGATKRELLNGAFVAVPSNRDAVVLSSKAFDALEAETAAAVETKAKLTKGEQLQSAHDSLVGAGALCIAPDAKSLGTKSLVNSVEALQDRCRDALGDLYGRRFSWLRGIVPDGAGGGVVVFEARKPDFDSYEHSTYQQTYTDDGQAVTLTGEATEVGIQEIVVPDADPVLKSMRTTDQTHAAADMSSDEADIQRRALAIRATTAHLQ
jgi:hypothetical protein